MTIRAPFAPQFRKACIAPDSTIRQALESLNVSGVLIACLVDTSGKLLAIVNDSDIRRALLRKVSLDDAVSSIANYHPVVMDQDATELEIRAVVERTGRREIPLVDGEGRLQDVFVLGVFDERISHTTGDGALTPTPTFRREKFPHPMFILAGGLGTRLRAVVADRPKPLALIGDRPILELLLEHARSCGISNFYLSINYMGEMIESFLSAPRFSDLNIRYVREEKRLGTAGSIGYVADAITHPLLVANADVLTNVPFDNVLRFHEESKADVTCVVRTHHMSIPYGVVELEGNDVVGLREKPSYDFVINAGIYVLSPAVCRLVRKDEYLDMPSLIRDCLARGLTVTAFPLHEYWLDVGKPEDYRKANEEIDTIFQRSPSERNA